MSSWHPVYALGEVRHAVEADCWAAAASADNRFWKLVCPKQGIVSLPMRPAAMKRREAAALRHTPYSKPKLGQLSQKLKQLLW